jgi:hypothetical protein
MTLPVNIPFVDASRKIDYRWLNELQRIVQGSQVNANGAVLDGSNTTYGQMTLFQGPLGSRPQPDVGSIYFALDTKQIFAAVGGVWMLIDSSLTGDVIKAAGSTITELATVFPNPGTYGSANQVPVISIDSKGRVTNLTFEQVQATITPSGPNGSLQFNNGGVQGGTTQITFNPLTGALSFTNPLPTFNNLSPLTSKGDVLTHNGTNNVRLPVGANGKFLRANSATATGLEWADDDTIEVRFNFGDASPKPIATIPANRIVRQATITIIDAFNDATATLSLSNSLLDLTDVAPSVAGTFSNNPGVQFSSPTQIVLNITPGTSTVGSGLVSLTLEE